MNLRDHDEDDSKKVWLSSSGNPSEVDLLLEWPTDTEKRVAFGLGARCGLRSAEVLDVAPQHVVDSDAGTFLRVWEGKGDKYRETPIPDDLATIIRTIGEYSDAPADEPVLSIESTRSLRRWIQDAREELAEETEDPGWHYLSTHDLRRTWATALRSAGVDAEYALEWGGWEDLETFLDHYKGAYGPEAQARERQKVEWL